MYVAGRKNEACTLKLDLKTGTKVAIGLDGLGLNYRAPNYDVLADNSATWGDFVEAKYTAAGKLHIVAIRGSGRKAIDAKKLAHECQMISEIQTDYFGGAPYSKYVWQVYSHSGPGPSYGIEHLSSCEIMMGTEVSTGMSGLLAHEYLHLWNVKRIRSKVLGPFDYTKLPKTGALWWLEGVTDYLTQSLQRRYGRTTDVEFFADIAGNLAGLERSEGYKKVSAYDCSYRIGEAAEGMGNSNGYGMSYYECGFLLGLVFDIELMERTGGKRSLDDVELALWKLCKDSKPGFEEGEIRNQLVLAGGASLGVLYDQLVMKPGEIPLGSALSKVGLRLTKEPSGRYSISAADATTWQQIKLRNLWQAKKRTWK
jgi:predicted metalloprotease with PDZ domain